LLANLRLFNKLNPILYTLKFSRSFYLDMNNTKKLLFGSSKIRMKQSGKKRSSQVRMLIRRWNKYKRIWLTLLNSSSEITKCHFSKKKKHKKKTSTMNTKEKLKWKKPSLKLLSLLFYKKLLISSTTHRQ